MTKENEQPTQDMANKINPERICDYQQTSTVNTGENNNKNYMNIQNENPVTAQAEQVTAYAAASENGNSVTNNLKLEKNMKEETLNTAEEMVDTTNSNNVDSITAMNENLSEKTIKICKEAEEKIVNMLEPFGLAGTVMGKNLINLTDAYKNGKIKIARLKMNRRPKAKAIKALRDSIMRTGQQIMLLVIPAIAAKEMGFEVEDFNGNEIPEEELIMTIVIIDGQTRLLAYLEAIKVDSKYLNCTLYAYFPLNWVSLNEMLTSINLKAFSWKNSDFITGILGNGNVEEEKKEALKYLKGLESVGYNYTSACEWVTFRRGIISKTPLVNAMNLSSSYLDLQHYNHAIEIIKAAREKFTGEYESALKRKAFPEFIITKWNEAGRELNDTEKEAFLKKFFDGLSDEDVKKIADPSGYERGKGEKKEDLIIKQLKSSFEKFQLSHPYSEFKEK